MWKVKKASLYTLGQLGSRTANEALPYLIKLLKESPINKQKINETIVKLGLEGESVLLKLMAQVLLQVHQKVQEKPKMLQKN